MGPQVGGAGGTGITMIRVRRGWRGGSILFGSDGVQPAEETEGLVVGSEEGLVLDEIAGA